MYRAAMETQTQKVDLWIQEGREEEDGMSEDNREAHTLPYVKQTANENLLYDSGSLTRAL